MVAKGGRIDFMFLATPSPTRPLLPLLNTPIENVMGKCNVYCENYIVLYKLKKKVFTFSTRATICTSGLYMAIRNKNITPTIKQ